MRFRTISVREDVYEALRRLSEVNNVTISDLIKQLVTSYTAMSEIKEMLRQCLGKTGINANNLSISGVVNTESIRDSIRENPKELINESLINLEDNPWVKIIRSRAGIDEGREGG
ncbi:hypothetical protein JCM16161A_22940 [Vulcanisaeta sp. JCM 16161]|uniref:hypothetical protein n=1 Tax=Vulcanisaeta sp. JCM 16161 TaxID=1295372 RepID=UPI0006D28331|nr:hypothetical protein [Vulcanisaeta sp. JCM 16161]